MYLCFEGTSVTGPDESNMSDEEWAPGIVRSEPFVNAAEPLSALPTAHRMELGFRFCFTVRATPTPCFAPPAFAAVRYRNRAEPSSTAHLIGNC